MNAAEPEGPPWSYRDRLVACARKVLEDEHEAEDVAQEVLIRQQTGLARDAVSLPAWLFSVCYRVAVDRLRDRRRRERTHAAHAVAASRERAGPELGADEAEKLRALVQALGDPYRTAVTLRYLERRSFGEVAQQMGTIERTARTWVARGLEKLRQESAT